MVTEAKGWSCEVTMEKRFTMRLAWRLSFRKALQQRSLYDSNVLLPCAYICVHVLKIINVCTCTYVC